MGSMQWLVVYIKRTHQLVVSVCLVCVDCAIRPGIMSEFRSVLFALSILVCVVYGKSIMEPLPCNDNTIECREHRIYRIEKSLGIDYERSAERNEMRKNCFDWYDHEAITDDKDYWDLPTHIRRCLSGIRGGVWMD